MGIKEKLPLINSSSKGTRIAGYVLYGFAFLIILGMILPGEDKTVSESGSSDAVGDASDAGGSAPDGSAILSFGSFGNYTFDGQDDVRATVKKGTDIYHMMGTAEVPDGAGYTKDGASYTITSTGKKVKGYIDYSGDGFVVILQPRRSSVTKNEFTDIMNTFQRVD